MTDLTYKKVYGIEEHLKQFRDIDGYRILYDSWRIEKEEYVKRLDTVGMTYQTYSLHDASHSEAILMQIAYFLGEDRVKQMSPTDTWLILECAYCHDLGMVVTAEDLYNELASMDKKQFEAVSRAMSESEDYEIKASWSYLEPLFRYGNWVKKHKENAWESEFETAEKYKNLNNLISIYHEKWYKWPMHFSKAFMVVIQEYCRPRHAEMSYRMIEKEVDERTYEGLIPIRLRHLIAEIAKMHGEDRENVIDKLSYEIQGFKGDYAHPRYVAELIRIGDLLDMDNNRFNKYQLAVAGSTSYSSFAHQLKHKALKDFLITPQNIIVKADFVTEDARKIFEYDELGKKVKDSKKKPKESKSNPEEVNLLTQRAFKELSGWLKMLRQELNFFSQNWLRIVPEGLLGSCPYFEQEELLFNGKGIESDILELRYHITAKRATEIIEGAGLYENIFVAFIREVLQNSMDATKRKIYNELVKKSRNDFSNPLEFYQYIAQDIKQLLIQVDCRGLKKDKKQKIIFSVRDKGSGISYERLKGMQHIGDISDYATNEQARKMPAWWKPTGSFGIGLQTVFYFSKMFKLTTRTEEEQVLRTMWFYSTQIGGKIDVIFEKSEKKTQKFGYGTEIEIDISSEIIKLLQLHERFDRNADYFGRKIEMYKSKIEDTIKSVRGSFGLPINLNLVKTDEDILEPDRYLCCCFGTHFIDIKSNRVSSVLDKDTEPFREEKYCGFSCWDAENRILIRYRWPLKMQKDTDFKVYFNEIYVNDYALSKMVQIPFFESEVYLFDEKAENYLEVNRDKFLYEKRRYIVNRICKTHLKCMQRLLKTGEKTSENREEIETIWAEGDEYGYHGSVRNYFELLINKKNISKLNRGVSWFVQNDDMISAIDDSAVYSDIDINTKDNLWLTDASYKCVNTVHLNGSSMEGVRYIVEDAFSGYLDLAITEMFCMRDIYNNYMIIYKTASRSGNPVQMEGQGFKLYLRMRYAEMSSQESKLVRLLLPGIEKYRAICVNTLKDNLGSAFEKKWDSAIIMPVTLQELECFLDLQEEKDAIVWVNEELLSKKNLSYTKIKDYIEKYSISKVHRKQGIDETYRELLISIWGILRK